MFHTTTLDYFKVSPDTQEHSESGGYSYRLKLLFLIVPMLALIYFVIVVIGGSLAENIGRLLRNNIYVSVSYWDVPLFIAVPAYLALTYILLLRLLDRATETAVKVSTNIAIIFAVAAIIARPVYGYLASSHMETNGYTFCWSYSSPSLMSPSVWVKKPGYCVQNTGKVRKEMLKWMDSLREGKTDIPVDIVREHAILLMETWEKNEQEKYPQLH